MGRAMQLKITVVEVRCDDCLQAERVERAGDDPVRLPEGWQHYYYNKVWPFGVSELCPRCVEKKRLVSESLT